MVIRCWHHTDTHVFGTTSSTRTAVAYQTLQKPFFKRPQSRLGDKPLKLERVCPQKRDCGPKRVELTHTHPGTNFRISRPFFFPPELALFVVLQFRFGKKHVEIEWFVPKTGLQSVKR